MNCKLSNSSRSAARGARAWPACVAAVAATVSSAVAPLDNAHADRSRAEIGREVAVSRHLRDGEEFRLPTRKLIEHGRRLFEANWTDQEGGGRPFSKGTGNPLVDSSRPLVFPRNFNRISAPDANSCAGCHNAPFGMSGGGGDIVANVFVTAQRFDFVDFDHLDTIPTAGALDELGAHVTQLSVGNSRNTLGMFGSGFIEMLARQITDDLRAKRDRLRPGRSVRLRSKGIDYGVLKRHANGSWDTSRVEGIPSTSLATSGSNDPPSLIIRPFHQSGHVISLRQFTNNAFNHHHGIQSTERFGEWTDPDGDGIANELSRADVTAAVIFQATLPVPGRVMPAHPEARRAVARGEWLFARIGCAGCHIPYLELDRGGWIYSEPNPYNPPGDLRPGEAPTLEVDLTDPRLPGRRLKPINGVVRVPAFTDLKLHDITSGPSDPNREPIDISKPAGSQAFFAGNAKFLTRKLWGVANEPPYFHHGQYTTLRQAVLAHAGEAQRSAAGFRALPERDQDAVIEFLKSLQVLPPRRGSY